MTTKVKGFMGHYTRASKAGRRKVAGDNLEFSVVEPQEQIPIIASFFLVISVP